MSQIIDLAIRNLVKLNKCFKYSVTATVMQLNGAGFTSTISSFNDADTDGSVLFKRTIGDNLVVVAAFCTLI